MANILADVQRITRNTAAEFTGEALIIGQWAICLNTDRPDVDDQLVRRTASGAYKFYNIENLSNFTVVDVTSSITAVSNTIYFVDTTSGNITITLPDATSNSLQTRIYKVTDIESADVLVETVSGVQNIGNSTEQLIQGESEGIFIVENTNGYNIIQDNRGGVQNKLSRSTMIISGFTVTPTTGNLVNISAGTFAVEDPDGLTTPTGSFKRFSGITDYAITGANTQGYTTLQIDGNGNITQTLNYTTDSSDWTLKPRICAVVHIFGTGTVESVAYWWTVGQNPSMRLNAYLDFIGVQSKGVVVSHNSTANLQISHTGGVLLGAGLDGNFTPSLPDVQPVVAQTPVSTILYATSSGSPFQSPPVSLIDPTKYDVGGVVTAIGGGTGTSTVQRVFILLNGSVCIQYGQNTYGSLNDAIAALSAGADTFTQAQQTVGTSVLAGYIVLNKTATDLTNTTVAQFFTPDIGGASSSASLSKFTDLLDTPSTYAGDLGKLAIVNANEDGIEFKGQYEQSNPLASLNLTGDPTGSIGQISLFGSLSADTSKWAGGVLAPNGKIYGIPYNSTEILEIDPVAQTTNLFGSLTGTAKWIGGTLAPNGKIYGIPYSSTQILEIDPVAQTTNLFGSLTDTAKWIGGTLAPNGKIYGIPLNSTQILEIDPVTQTTNLFGSLTGAAKWTGGTLAPNGKIYGIPRDSTQILEIDPVAQTTNLFGSLTGTGKWYGGTLAPNGKIYGIPYSSTQVLEINPTESGNEWWALSNYVNKF